MRIVIVGAGLFGAVCAHELGRAGHDCRIVEKRDHIGGNIFTRYDAEAQCHEHVYGAHIFHTNSDRIWDYVRRFADFNGYTNRVKARSGATIFSFPINLMTMHQLFGASTPEAARAAVAADLVPCDQPANMEEFCLSVIGRTLYETFIKGYTTKQWGRSPRDLPADIVKRLPVRYDFNDNYFSDRYQGIPVGGYTAMVERMLGDTPVELGVDFLADRDRLTELADLVIYTGSIDSWFAHVFGPLEYRSLRFERELVDTPDFQGNAVMNYVDAGVPFTRILEHKHFDMHYAAEKSLITREYPAEWTPGQIEYYPVNDARNMAMFERYRALAAGLKGKVHFGGRLGEYRYYDMHQVIGAALAFCERVTGKTEQRA